MRPRGSSARRSRRNDIPGDAISFFRSYSTAVSYAPQPATQALTADRMVERRFGGDRSRSGGPPQSVRTFFRCSDLMRSSSGPDRSNDRDRSKSIPRRRPAIGCFKAVANSDVSYTKKGFCSDRLAISIRCSNH